MNVRVELKHVKPYNLVRFVDKAKKLPTQWGTFIMHGFIENSTGKEHLALVYGDPARNEAPLIRLHSECLTGDALFSTRCDCGFQLNRALQNIVEANERLGFAADMRDYAFCKGDIGISWNR